MRVAGGLDRITELARKYDLVLFSDEIYEKITYEDAVHIHTASVADDVAVLTFSGLSKAYRMPGYRAGWVAISVKSPLTEAEIKAYLREHPQEAAALMNENPSYVFFRELPAGLPGPLGALGVPHWL